MYGHYWYWIPIIEDKIDLNVICHRISSFNSTKLLCFEVNSAKIFDDLLEIDAWSESFDAKLCVVIESNGLIHLSVLAETLDVPASVEDYWIKKIVELYPYNWYVESDISFLTFDDLDREQAIEYIGNNLYECSLDYNRKNMKESYKNNSAYSAEKYLIFLQKYNQLFSSSLSKEYLNHIAQTKDSINKFVETSVKTDESIWSYKSNEKITALTMATVSLSIISIVVTFVTSSILYEAIRDHEYNLYSVASWLGLLIVVICFTIYLRNESRIHSFGKSDRKMLSAEELHLKGRRYELRALEKRNDLQYTSLNCYHLDIFQMYENLRISAEIKTEDKTKNRKSRSKISLVSIYYFKKASNYYRLSAKKGDYLAQYDLGRLYTHGLLPTWLCYEKRGKKFDQVRGILSYSQVKRNMSKSKKDSNSDSSSAETTKKSDLTRRGFTNDRNGLRWYMLAALNGYNVAQCIIGVSYEFSKGVCRNHEMSR